MIHVPLLLDDTATTTTTTTNNKKSHKVFQPLHTPHTYIKHTLSPQRFKFYMNNEPWIKRSRTMSFSRMRVAYLGKNTTNSTNQKTNGLVSPLTQITVSNNIYLLHIHNSFVTCFDPIRHLQDLNCYQNVTCGMQDYECS